MRQIKKIFLGARVLVQLHALPGSGVFAWALVKPRGFYALPGRWVLTWERLPGSSWPASWWFAWEHRAGDWRGYSERSEWPRGCDCIG